MDHNLWSSQLREQAQLLHAAAESGDSPEVANPISKLSQAASSVADSWSGSSIGYHSRVYYQGFVPPPPGSHFSSEWGSYPAFVGSTTGDWREYDYDTVINEIERRSGNLSLDAAYAASRRAKTVFESGKAECLSILATFLMFRDDEYVKDLRDKIGSIEPLTAAVGVRAQLPKEVVSRDSLATSQGLQAAPHQQIIARVVELQQTFKVCGDVATLAQRAAAHIDRLTALPTLAGRQMGSKVFIGHGNSLLWRELKDFVADRLNLPWDEFNRVPVAGTTTVGRLTQMLDEAGFAFLVLTAEDEHNDGTVVARQNVIHEVGLFQGRLGFERAIVLLEEGCAEFSNINGLTQLRFPKGKISAVFENVRAVLEREKFLEP